MIACAPTHIHTHSLASVFVVFKYDDMAWLGVYLLRIHNISSSTAAAAAAQIAQSSMRARARARGERVELALAHTSRTRRTHGHDRIAVAVASQLPAKKRERMSGNRVRRVVYRGTRTMLPPPRPLIQSCNAHTHTHTQQHGRRLREHSRRATHACVQIVFNCITRVWSGRRCNRQRSARTHTHMCRLVVNTDKTHTRTHARAHRTETRCYQRTHSEQTSALRLHLISGRLLFLDD